MSNKKKLFEKSFFSVLGLILVLLILVLANVLFARVNIRWDATGEKLYSLSDSTKQILQNLHSDVTLIVRSAVLPSTRPKEKQILTFAARNYRIDRVLTTHGGDITTLVCNDPAQGA